MSFFVFYLSQWNWEKILSGSTPTLASLTVLWLLCFFCWRGWSVVKQAIFSLVFKRTTDTDGWLSRPVDLTFSPAESSSLSSLLPSITGALATITMKTMNGGGRGDYKIHTGRLSKTEQIVQNRADLSMLEVEDVDPDRQVPKKNLCPLISRSWLPARFSVASLHRCV